MEKNKCLVCSVQSDGLFREQDAGEGDDERSKLFCSSTCQARYHYGDGRRLPIFSLREEALKNNEFRHVVFTTPQMQGVVMTLKSGETIPWERHEDATQFIHIVQGKCMISISAEWGTKIHYELVAGNDFVVEPGIRHLVENLGNENLKLYTIYSPPQHH